jgi:hypothetical protein
MDENSNPEADSGIAAPPEAMDVDFNSEILMRPTSLEREVGHELDDESAAFIHAAIKAFGVDVKRADLGYQMFCEFRQEQDD